jgi:hypothetical protein
MTKDYVGAPSKSKLGVIRGVPFVDTPREQLETVTVSRASWEELKGGVKLAQEGALAACCLSGLAIAVALIVAMNVWR